MGVAGDATMDVPRDWFVASDLCLVAEGDEN